MKSGTLAENFRFKLFALMKLPLLGFTGASLVDKNSRMAQIRIPMRWPNRSFRKALAFGPILMGAECSAGYLFGDYIFSHHMNLGFVISQSEATLLRPFSSAGIFVAQLPDAIERLIQTFNPSSKKISYPVRVEGYDETNQLCATFRFEVTVFANR